MRNRQDSIMIWMFATCLLAFGEMLVADEPLLDFVPVFPNEGESHYRIPSLVVANDGTVLAFCNRRVGTVADRAPETALVLRRSKDGGKTWLPIQDLGARKGWQFTIGSGIVDANTGEVMVMCRKRPGTPAAVQEQKDSGESVGSFVVRSRDAGGTWSFDPLIIKPNSFGKTGDCHGSGAGITLQYGPKRERLLMPTRFVMVHGEDPENLKKNHYNCAIYSDDHGKTWKTSEPVQVGTGEGCLVELPNGVIYYNSRAYFRDGKRRIALSHDGGETFESFSESDVLTECNHGTNASLLGVPASCFGKFMVLFANPPLHAPGFNLGRDRRQMTVRLSMDDAKTWPISRIVFDGPSGYSSMAMNRNQQFLLLFEKGKRACNDSGISMARFNLTWLRGDKRE